MSNLTTYRFNPRCYNPNGWQLLRFMRDPSVRFIILFGGSSSAKSYSVAQTVQMMTLFDDENTIVFRKVGASIEKSIYEDFKVSCRQMDMDDYFKFTRNSIRCGFNGAKIDFTGLDDSEKIKGTRKIDGRIQDLPWGKAFIRKSVMTGRTVVPVHFIAENSPRFYRVANLCKKLGLKFNFAMLLLPDEMYKAQHGTFKVVFGDPIPPETFDNSRTPYEWAQWVRAKVYEL